MRDTGDGLNIVCKTGYSFHDDWMTFACWYSILKSLPDAKFSIFCPSVDSHGLYFQWAPRCRVNFSTILPTNTPLLIVPPLAMAVRSLDQKCVDLLSEIHFVELDGRLCGDVKDDTFLPFVHYQNGCGKFVVSEWINKAECPFPWAERFMTHTATANEVRVLKLWKQLHPLYATVAKG
jgi:hypothetical protein